MRTFLLCISISVLLLQCFALGQNSVSARFLDKVKEDDGFIRLKARTTFLHGEEIEAVAELLVTRTEIKLRNDSINDTVIVERKVRFFTKDCIVLNKKSKYISVLATIMCWDYHTTCGIKKIRLSREDLENFAKKAKWSIRRVKTNE